MLSPEILTNQLGQVSSIIYFSTPMIFSYQLIYKKKDIKDFPLILSAMKFIGALIILSFVIANRTKKENLDFEIIYYSLNPLASNGITISTFFSIIYLTYYLNLDSTKQVIYAICFIVGLFIVEIFITLIMLIPFLSHFLFFIGYTILIISPFNEAQKIYVNWDYNLIPSLDIHACTLMAFFIGFFLRNIKNNNWVLFVIEFNLFISICGLGFYYYLYYKGSNQTQSDNKNNIDENLLNTNNYPTINTQVESKNIEEVSSSHSSDNQVLNVPSTNSSEGNLQTLSDVITPNS